jgi:hypothetical protein
MYGPHARPSLEEDFLICNPPISISNLIESSKDGVYVVGGIVKDVVDPHDWWYAACSCHASLSAEGGEYYCNICVKVVSKMIPRYFYYFVNFYFLLIILEINVFGLFIF